ncbi:hypothetical protein HMPREF0860_0072 [Treponema socranskii subsp. socranskii VPI DR56BR1116 = ATCC 35536]|uniref:Uncharacterized protein n=1 Tax=Treponema socranskii subsp. socranskii VPI DR56BR1116 = ATCC 35536 TaxID=1125725 RepID=U1FBS7_TRESO|nr:hypothetical protein HMPREF1325_2320 [Treponema socranskii subsp. socranskii VPI DR56BR1116 = ATCC 35536]ERK02587.1 hypothetical protein HMPREF0860_0072 [Treponema socranskii subsp. socranskii VPI DR56BR1116 = ATCC 35536]
MHGCTANGHCSESYRKSGGEKRLCRFSLIGDARQFLRRELRASRSLQVPHCSESYRKSGGEKRLCRFSLIGDAQRLLRTARNR